VDPVRTTKTRANQAFPYSNINNRITSSKIEARSRNNNRNNNRNNKNSNRNSRIKVRNSSRAHHLKQQVLKSSYYLPQERGLKLLS
jgi:hypothetical protein